MAAGGETDLGAAVFDAASQGDIQRLRQLVRFKRFSKIRGSLSWRDPFGRTPLMEAAACGHTEMVRLLVEEYGVNVEESKVGEFTGEELTPLVYAANVGHHKTVEVLLKNCAKVDHAYPLHRACLASSSGNLESVKLLIASGADVNRQYMTNRDEGELVHESTPLAVASEQVCPSIVEYLLQKGADPNIPDKHGNRPMHSAFSAIWNRHSERRCRGSCSKDGDKIIKMLIEHGATQTRNVMDLTPVMIGALTGNLLKVSDSEALFTLTQEETVKALDLMASHYLLNEHHQVGLQILTKSFGLTPGRAASAAEASCPYGDFQEPLNLEDLDAIRSDSTYLQVVALMIRERILSKEGQKNYLWQAIRDFVDRCRPTPDGRQLALRALKHETNLEIESGFFCGFAVESLYRLLDPNNVSLAESILEEVVILFKLAAINLSPHVTEMTPESRKEAIQYHRFKSMNILHLLGLYANYPPLSDADKELLIMMVKQFIMAYDMTTDVIRDLRQMERAIQEEEDGSPVDGIPNQNSGTTVFHMYYPVVARRRPADESNIKERLITILLKCGADPSQVNVDGYSALHLFVKMCPGAHQTDTFRKGVVTPLAEWACPILKRNPKTGRHAVEDCSNPDTKQLLINLALPPLLNLTARVIRKNKIPYRDAVPITLAAFLDMDV